MTAAIFETNCLTCGKPMQVVNEEFVGCVVCDDCPFPKEPCETCGKLECDGECCDCAYCVQRRSGTMMMKDFYIAFDEAMMIKAIQQYLDLSLKDDAPQVISVTKMPSDDSSSSRDLDNTFKVMCKKKSDSK
jgi:hypothetical protein